MSKVLIALIAVLGLAAVVALWFVGARNRFVTLDEGIKGQWAQVESQYQRRADLIPNLVETVKGYAAHEAAIFEEVAQARAQIGAMKITPETLNDPEAFKKYQAAQGQMGLLASRLLAISENYPDLKAQAGFQELQAQLEGTENRIAVERQRYNDAVREYNTAIRRFPGSLVAGFGRLREKPYFESEPGAAKAPHVSFTPASAPVSNASTPAH